MDPRIIEAFIRSLLEGVKDTELPMEASDFAKNYFSQYSCDEFKLNLRQSSWKKIGKLLEHMHGKLIEYEEPKNLGRKVITKVHRKHTILLEFAP